MNLWKYVSAAVKAVESILGGYGWYILAGVAALLFFVFIS